MKRIKKFSDLFFLSAVALSFTLTSCSKDDDKKKGGLSFEPDEVEVGIEKTTSVAVSGGTAPFEAIVKDEKIATVQADADIITITGVSEGTTTIAVTDENELSGTILVTVKESIGLEFDKEELYLAIEKEDVVTVKGGVAPYTAEVEDASVASASVKEDKITIKGLKNGTTTIIVTGRDKKNKGTISVTVK